MRKLWLMMALMAFVGTSSVYLEAAPKKKCTKTADCKSECLGWDFGADRWCSDTVAPDTAGKVCDTATEGECNDDKQVACGKSRWKKCDKNKAPDCTAPFENQQTVNMAGCT